MNLPIIPVDLEHQLVTSAERRPLFPYSISNHMYFGQYMAVDFDVQSAVGQAPRTFKTSAPLHEASAASPIQFSHSIWTLQNLKRPILHLHMILLREWESDLREEATDTLTTKSTYCILLLYTTK